MSHNFGVYAIRAKEKTREFAFPNFPNAREKIRGPELNKRLRIRSAGSSFESFSSIAASSRPAKSDLLADKRRKELWGAHAALFVALNSKKTICKWRGRGISRKKKGVGIKVHEAAGERQVQRKGVSAAFVWRRERAIYENFDIEW